MIRALRLLTVTAILACLSLASSAQVKPFRVLALYSKNVETDHALFAVQAIQFFTERAGKDGFEFSASDDWDDLNLTKLSSYRIVLWLNDSPQTEQQRRSFETYMDHGGAWLGFHAAGYNDNDTKWPWFVRFLGGAIFYGNSWPPLPAKLRVDSPTHPMMTGTPTTYQSPANEWYIWKPDPRDNPDVKVLLTLDPSNYPIGLKDVLISGDLPVVWTNTRYKMVYMNMGHGDKIFTDPTQNHLFENTLLWLARSK